MSENLIHAFEMLGQGMLGIFVVLHLPPVFLGDPDAVVLAAEAGALLLVNGEKVVEFPGISFLVGTLSACNLQFHDIVSPFP